MNIDRADLWFRTFFLLGRDKSIFIDQKYIEVEAIEPGWYNWMGPDGWVGPYPGGYEQACEALRRVVNQRRAEGLECRTAADFYG